VVVDGVVDAVVAEREAEGQSADWLFVGLDFLKATPHTEGERILKSALFADRAFYLEKGNIDLEHLTILGYRMVDPATGRLLIKNPRDYEIGLPVEVRDTAHAIFAKGDIYRGHEQADKIWHSITTQTPPQPGVGT